MRPARAPGRRAAAPRAAATDRLSPVALAWMASLCSVGAAERVVAAHIGAVALLRIAVHQGARVKRVGEASHFVLDREQRPAVGGVDQVAEAVLVLVALFRDEA